MALSPTTPKSLKVRTLERTENNYVALLERILLKFSQEYGNILNDMVVMWNKWSLKIWPCILNRNYYASCSLNFCLITSFPSVTYLYSKLPHPPATFSCMKTTQSLISYGPSRCVVSIYYYTGPSINTTISWDSNISQYIWLHVSAYLTLSHLQANRLQNSSK